MKKYEEDEEYIKAWDEYEKTLDDKTPLWSQESFSRDFNKAYKQIRNDREKDEEENKNYEN